MKNIRKINLLICAFIVTIGVTYAQEQKVPTTQVIPDSTKLSYNQISKTGGLVVFPTNNQSQTQQKKDEYDCYIWAMEQTGIDPLNLPKQEVVQQSGPTGGAVRGAARGAAAGAAIGAIAGDAGKGAAIGATAGGLGGARGGRRAQSQQNEKAVNDAKSNEEKIKEQFKKAFSACLEGKGYTVK